MASAFIDHSLHSQFPSGQVHFFHQGVGHLQLGRVRVINQDLHGCLGHAAVQDVAGGTLAWHHLLRLLVGTEEFHEVRGHAGHYIPVHVEVGAFNLHQVKQPMCENGHPDTHKEMKKNTRDQSQ